MQNEVIKYRLKIKKNKELRFISHLDWQNLIQKIFRRCELKLVLSQGFNKMPKVSYSPALPIFMESDCELVNFQVEQEIDEKKFLEDFEKYSPNGIEVVEFQKLSEQKIATEPKSLENLVQWAQYEIGLTNFQNNIYNLDEIRYIIEKCLSSEELLLTKINKKGIEKQINYRNSLKSIELRDDKMVMVLKAGQNEQVPALRADEFLKLLFKDINVFKIKRVNFFDTNLEVI